MRTLTQRPLWLFGLTTIAALGLIGLMGHHFRAAWFSASQWLILQQRQFYRALGEQMQALPEQLTTGQVGLITLLCFTYGILHAAGPGHGKVVISAYLLSQPSRVWMGLKLSAAAALLQGLTAIVIVSVLVWSLGWVAREVLRFAQGFELVSFFAIALLGALLTLRAGRLLWQHGRLKLTERVPTFTPVVEEHNSACTLCGHAHHVAPEQWLGSTRGQQWGLIIAVGLRPCTGALLILMMANVLGYGWVGLLGVLAMSIGTALTVALIALLSVQARSWMTRWLALQPQSLPVFTAIVAALGGLLLTAFGLSLGIGVWLAPAPSVWF